MRNNFIIAIYLCILPAFIFGQEIKSIDTVSINIAYDESLFKTVRKNDAIASLNIWVQSFADELELNAQIQPAMYLHYIGNMHEVVSARTTGDFDLINLLAIDYVRFAKRDYWIPVAVSVDDGHIPEEYLVLVADESNITSLNQLKGMSIGLLGGPDSHFSRMWLENRVMEEAHISTAEFFDQIHEESKASKVVLNLFFNQTNVCIVGYNAYQIMVELNPQIDKKLRIIETSPGFIKGLVCIRKDFYQEYYKDVINAIFGLTNSESGNQILKLFGESRLIPFEPRFLDNIEKLVADHQRLMGLEK